MITKHLCRRSRAYNIAFNATRLTFIRVSSNTSPTILSSFQPLITTKQYVQNQANNPDSNFEKEFLGNFSVKLSNLLLAKKRGLYSPKNEVIATLATLVAIEFKSASSIANSHLFASDSFWTGLLKIVQKYVKMDSSALSHNMLRFLLENQLDAVANHFYSYLTRSSTAQSPLPIPTQLIWLQHISALPDEDAVFALAQRILETGDNHVDRF